MRTTLTLDDDVAAAIERLRRERDLGLKELVNDALRIGLPVIQDGSLSAKPPPYQVKPWQGMKPLLPNMDNIGKVLDYLDVAEMKR